MSNQGIADRLNAGKVPSPAARKLQSGAKLSLHFRKSDEPPWSAKAVDRILHNDVYQSMLMSGRLNQHLAQIKNNALIVERIRKSSRL